MPPRNESISLREYPLSEVGDHEEPHDTEREASNFEEEEVDPRQWESSRTRACVLVGSAILQLPIWGTLRPSI